MSSTATGSNTDQPAANESLRPPQQFCYNLVAGFGALGLHSYALPDRFA